MMRHARLAVLIGTVLLCGGAAAAKDNVRKRPAPRRHVDLVICLDTSGSMSGLIESAKQKLWAVVNELATAKPQPVLRVALYHYGNTGLRAETGWVEKLCGLTDDLDTVYGKLFALKTNGGTEYVARVVRAATTELKWNTDKNTLRVVFVAGNEPATQDRKYTLETVCKAAATKGIIINTIFCGPLDVGKRTGWAKAATLADGRYAAIDQNSGTIVVKTPFDVELAELSRAINGTYIRFGRAGRAGAAKQKAQDANALSLGASAGAARAVSKSTTLYSNARWDLVDATEREALVLTEVKPEDLPEPMRKMTPEQRKVYVAKKAAERKKLQAKIRVLGQKRLAFIKKEMARKGLSEAGGFDAALRSMIREQATKKNLVFEKKPGK